jgi:hypothetical protein
MTAGGRRPTGDRAAGDERPGICVALRGAVRRTSLVRGTKEEVMKLHAALKYVGALRRCVPLVVFIVAAISPASHLGEVQAQPRTAADAGNASPIYGITVPAGYRDWRMISVASVGTPVNDLRVKLGNDIAIDAYRRGTRPFPDGSIIARLAYSQVTSEENNKACRAAAEHRGLPAQQIEQLLAASFVAGAPTNVQFMVKDSKKYTSTGG